MSSSPPPAIIIHGLDHGRAALAAFGTEKVVLKSAVGAACVQGIGWWRRLVDRLHRDFPAADFIAVLDCGASLGLALEALRVGGFRIVVAGDGPGWRAVKEAAEQKEAWGEGRWGCDNLDLLGAPDPGLSCREFLHRSGEGATCPMTSTLPAPDGGIKGEL